MFARYPGKDIQELCMAQIGNLATPKPLHGFDIKVFHADMRIGLGKFMGQLEMIVFPAIGNVSVFSSKFKTGLLPVVTAPFL